MFLNISALLRPEQRLSILYRLLLACLLAGCLIPAQASGSLAQTLQRLAPAANPRVVQLALRATSCARAKGLPAANYLAVIDYSLPSTRKRLWVFDLQHRRLLFNELVAHGERSGQKFAVRFSNRPQSHESSLGLYRTLNAYDGANGYSLRLQGLEPGFNNNAYARAIVIHGAAYVSRDFIEDTGRLGRSWGCPAVPEDVARPLIDLLKGGNYLFVYYPDARWLDTSRFLHCGGNTLIAKAD